MDEAFEIPYLKWRVGLDALFGLIPGIGDLVGALISGFVVWEGVRLRASPWVLLRMGMNVMFEFLLGSIPGVGDIFDIHFRANRKNVELLKSAGGLPETHARRSKWLVLVALGLFSMIFLAALCGMVFLLAILWKWGELIAEQIYQYLA
jgi:hypothetical protein